MTPLELINSMVAEYTKVDCLTLKMYEPKLSIPVWEKTLASIMAGRLNETPEEGDTARSGSSQLLDIAWFRLAYPQSVESGEHADFIDLFPSKKLTEIVEAYTKDGRGVALQSNLWEDTHIPMLDFVCPVSDLHTSIITNYIKAKSPSSVLPGYLYNSGNSYHFYGTPCTIQDMLLFWQSCVGLYPLIDCWWLANRFRDSVGSLRLNKTPVHSEPKFICKVA